MTLCGSVTGAVYRLVGALGIGALVTLLVWSTPVVQAARKAKPPSDGQLTDLEFGHFHLKVPVGWSTTADAARGVVKSSRSATKANAATIALFFSKSAAPSKGGVGKLMSAALPETGESVKVTSREAVAAGWGEVREVTLTRGTTAMVGVVMAFMDPKSGRSFAGSFVASKKRFKKLGGAALLFDIASSVEFRAPSLSSKPAPKPASSGRPTLDDDVIDPEMDVTPGLPPLTGANVAAKELAGEWRSAGMGAMLDRGDTPQPAKEGYLSRGTLYTFVAGGTYTLRYAAEGRRGFCISKVTLEEVGVYTFAGGTMRLAPHKRTGEVCRCSCQRKRKVAVRRSKTAVLSARSYEAYVAADTKRFVLRGHCASWMVHGECRTGSSGPPDRVHDETFRAAH